MGAPLSQTAKKRLEDKALWGAPRQNRSSDIIVINASRQPFHLAKSFCVQGHLTTGLMPVNLLKEKSSTVWGMESTKRLEGVQCTIRYEGQDGWSWINLMINVPYFGDNAVYSTSSWDLKVTPVVTAANHNQVRFTVTDQYTYSGARSMAQGPPKKPKGNRNVFMKISKSGSRAHKL